MRAWAFLATGYGMNIKNARDYFIEDENGQADIYLKKPKPRRNPFDYWEQWPLVKPKEIQVIIPVTKQKTP